MLERERERERERQRERETERDREREFWSHHKDLTSCLILPMEPSCAAKL